jgi:predicted regulator of Ras-like GTPase activity (Roadblock/LC7/MglB family)
MVDRLRDMQVSSPDIEASAVVSVDGLPIARGRRRPRLGHVGGHAVAG